VSVLALAGIGASYAGYFELIEIEGDVYTAYVGFDLVEYSGTWVWKEKSDRPEHEMVVFQGTYDPDDPPVPLLPDISTLAGHAKGMDSDTTYDGKLLFDNIFPLDDGFIPDDGWVQDGKGYWMADLKYHYIGSIPIHIDNTPTIVWDPVYEYDEAGNEIVVPGFNDFKEFIEFYGGEVIEEMTVIYGENNPLHTAGETEPVAPCRQLHYCDHIHIVIKIKLPQPTELTDNKMLQHKHSYAMIDIPVIQWNEFQCGQLPEKVYGNFPDSMDVNIAYQNPEGNPSATCYWLTDTYNTVGTPPVTGWNPNINDIVGDFDSLGWCVDTAHTVAGGVHGAVLYSSLKYKSTNPDDWPQIPWLQGNIHDPDPAEPDTPKDIDGIPLNWPAINYIINHKGDFGTVDSWDIQLAIWWYCDGVAWEPPGNGAYAVLTPEARDIVNATNQHLVDNPDWWDNFPNEQESWYAILLDLECVEPPDKQWIFIEVDP
jgi:hypothetical protein